MSILVKREQEKYFFLRLKTAVNYGIVKREAGAEVSRFEVSSFRRFLLLRRKMSTVCKIWKSNS